MALDPVRSNWSSATANELGSTAAKPPQIENRNGKVALLFLLPAAGPALVFLVYPTIYTFALSFNRGRRGEFTQWVGFDNYVNLFTKDPNFLDLSTFPPTGALFNNILWLIFYTGDRDLPRACSSPSWRRASATSRSSSRSCSCRWRSRRRRSASSGRSSTPRTATSACSTRSSASFHIGPISWLGDPGFVNAALIAVGIWASTGFATVILSAAIKSISSEIIEAARVDGANELQVFRRIILPMVSLPISVLAVTLTVNVVKLFDLTYVMTNGGPGTSSRVIAFTMYQESFPGGLFGKGAAVAMVMLVIMTPIMIYNVRRFRTASVV